VIVTIAAVLYIVDAVFIIGSLLMSPWGFGGVEGLVSLALAALLGAMGVGLLRRLSWARWLALGSSLLGWVLGSVLLLLSIGYLFMVAPAAMYVWTLLGSGIFSWLGALVLFGLLIWVAGIVISYLLFWHLCSDEGCEEFHVPPGSTQAVIASSGAWLGVFVLNLMVSGGGEAFRSLDGGDDTALHEAAPESEAQMAARLEREAYAERRAQAEAMLREQAEIEAAGAAGATPTAPSADSYTIEESPVPELQSAADLADDAEDSESPATRILKCVDASGGTIFTQGYCPPGSKPVRTRDDP
jgi:hypothetical protein